jgi:hypothetical protein
MGRLSRVVRSLRAECAQDTFEYLLVVGGVIVVLVLAFLAFDAVLAQFLGNACPSVDTAKGVAATAGSCVK